MTLCCIEKRAHMRDAEANFTFLLSRSIKHRVLMVKFCFDTPIRGILLLAFPICIKQYYTLAVIIVICGLSNIMSLLCLGSETH